jgi:hypothetical protein
MGLPWRLLARRFFAFGERGVRRTFMADVGKAEVWM